MPRHYLDVAKGVLICLVIISHIYLETLSVAKIPNSTFAWMRSWQWIHVSFFMPAFFIITGLCSNFEKEFKPFFISNVRTILIPAIVFDLFFFTIPSVFLGQGPWTIVMMGFVKRAFAFGGVFWFLPCLFLSKLIYWTLHKYTPNIILWSILIALVILGFVLHHFNLFPQKWWYVHQVFDLTIFLGVGQFLKTNSTDLKVFYRFGTAYKCHPSFTLTKSKSGGNCLCILLFQSEGLLHYYGYAKPSIVTLSSNTLAEAQLLFMEFINSF